MNNIQLTPSPASKPTIVVVVFFLSFFLWKLIDFFKTHHYDGSSSPGLRVSGSGRFNVDSSSRKKRNRLLIHFDMISTVSCARMSSSSSKLQSKICTNTGPM
ncbi:hypothetical protein TorRG33x02_319470 [Trema orientale]|uniref:Transmembrane protein n=1 Tax=Trema orientale TaxID=63057 RepID=A0A2P5BIV2_TREOI|nr:hypothetical protein TorRG33x02_319470 [Trema orientale]